MRQTVVGVFDQNAAAQRAADILRQRGIADEDGRITAADGDGTPGSATATEDEGLMPRIRDFFSGDVADDSDVSVYSEHVRRGGAVLKVQVEDETQVEVASQVCESAGAVDIDKRVDEWQIGGWSADSTVSPAPMSAPGMAAGNGGTRDTAACMADDEGGTRGRGSRCRQGR